jgi:DNA polymerase-4
MQVRELAEAVARRAEQQRLPGRTVTLKVKWSDFRITTRQRPLAAATYAAEPIADVAAGLLAVEVAPLLEMEGPAIRLLGVGLSGFDAPATGIAGWRGYMQPPLFASGD